MFMFRSRKTNLVRQLARKRRQLLQPQPDVRGLQPQPDVQGLLRRLQENQLEMLLRAVESRGRDAGSCVLLPQLQQEQLHVVCCQAWRWPDLSHAGELRRLPTCKSACDSVYVCCNPYHWSRMYQPEIPPPPYSRTNSDRIKPEDRAPSEVPLLCRDSFQGSVTTNGDSYTNTSEWCKLAYWELSERVGPLFPVEPPAFNVSGDVPHPDGLNLETLAKRSFSPPEPSVQKTRCKIGLGVTLSREADDRVWLYNRSDYPVFVNSPTLDGHAPARVPPDHCMCAHDPSRPPRPPDRGPADPPSVRVSFAKGWGPKYSRQEVTNCPCWIEVLLAPCR